MATHWGRGHTVPLGTQCPALMSCHVYLYLCMCVLYGYFWVCEYGGGDLFIHLCSHFSSNRRQFFKIHMFTPVLFCRNVPNFVLDMINQVRGCKTPGCNGKLAPTCVMSNGFGGCVYVSCRCDGCGSGGATYMNQPGRTKDMYWWCSIIIMIR